MRFPSYFHSSHVLLLTSHCRLQVQCNLFKRTKSFFHSISDCFLYLLLPSSLLDFQMFPRWDPISLKLSRRFLGTNLEYPRILISTISLALQVEEKKCAFRVNCGVCGSFKDLIYSFKGNTIVFLGLSSTLRWTVMYRYWNRLNFLSHTHLNLTSFTDLRFFYSIYTVLGHIDCKETLKNWIKFHSL